MEEKRPRGRPVTTGVTPKRNVRIGQLWDDVAAIAEADGETMTAAVTRALTEYRDRRTTEAG